MSAERRNLYRLLYVQPEAPTEVIKAAHRALMVKQRMHPDLGGDNDTAASLNAALAVLTDPVQRRAYDLSLKAKPRQAGAAGQTAASTQSSSAGASPIKPLPPAWLIERRCPFCQTAFAALPQIGSRCVHCDSPLTPLPKSPKPPKASATTTGEALGRRSGEQRFARDMPVGIHLPGDVRLHTGRLQDLSFTGLSFVAEVAPPKGSALRVSTTMFDAVAQVVTLRRQGGRCTVHAVLLTLELQRNASGVYVNTQA